MKVLRKFVVGRYPRVDIEREIIDSTYFESRYNVETHGGTKHEKREGMTKKEVPEFRKEFYAEKLLEVRGTLTALIGKDTVAYFKDWDYAHPEPENDG